MEPRKSEYQILKKSPDDWKTLQSCTSAILSDCGFETTIEKNVETVRGNVEIDVYAEKKSGYTTSLLCECKYWNTAVPQTIIHAFRNVVEDSGASQGIIISRNGFQKGSYEAAVRSNVALLSWGEFQEVFKMEYFNNIIDRNFKKGHQLRAKATAVLEIQSKYPFVLTDKEFSAFQSSREAYQDYLFYSFREHYEHLDSREITLTEVERGMRTAIKDLKIEAHSFKEFFDNIYFKCQSELVKTNAILELIGSRLDK